MIDYEEIRDDAAIKHWKKWKDCPSQPGQFEQEFRDFCYGADWCHKLMAEQIKIQADQICDYVDQITDYEEALKKALKRNNDLDCIMANVGDVAMACEIWKHQYEELNSVLEKYGVKHD